MLEEGKRGPTPLIYLPTPAHTRTLIPALFANLTVLWCPRSECPISECRPGSECPRWEEREPLLHTLKVTSAGPGWVLKWACAPGDQSEKAELQEGWLITS